MKTIAKRQTKYNQTLLPLGNPFVAKQTVHFVLQFVDPDLLSEHENAPLQEGENRVNPLRHLADLADRFDYSTRGNLLILAKQIIARGANVDALSSPKGETPLHAACFAGNVTNLDFVELMLEAGADTNAKEFRGMTPLMCTSPNAIGTSKFLLNWPSTDANSTNRSNESFRARVRFLLTKFSELVTLPYNPERVQHQFLLQPWREIEEILVERDALIPGSQRLSKMPSCAIHSVLLSGG
jgi:hypothetical protein